MRTLRLLGLLLPLAVAPGCVLASDVRPVHGYAYAYGYLFSLAVFRRYEQEGEAMVEPYFELLRAGGSRPPEELAQLVGLDLTDPAIWASGIEALDEQLDEAERLAGEIGLT